jgi:hypothetical protein
MTQMLAVTNHTCDKRRDKCTLVDEDVDID